MAASTTASATGGYAVGRRSPPTPLAAGAEVLGPGTEIDGVAGAMIEAEPNNMT